MLLTKLFNQSFKSLNLVIQFLKLHVIYNARISTYRCYVMNNENLGQRIDENSPSFAKQN